MTKLTTLVLLLATTGALWPGCKKKQGPAVMSASFIQEGGQVVLSAKFLRADACEVLIRTEDDGSKAYERKFTKFDKHGAFSLKLTLPAGTYRAEVFALKGDKRSPATKTKFSTPGPPENPRLVSRGKALSKVSCKLKASRATPSAPIEASVQLGVDEHGKGSLELRLEHGRGFAIKKKQYSFKQGAVKFPLSVLRQAPAAPTGQPPTGQPPIGQTKKRAHQAVALPVWILTLNGQYRGTLTCDAAEAGPPRRSGTKVAQPKKKTP